MIRLIAPLLLLTAIFWAAMFALPTPLKRRSYSVARQFAIAFAWAAMVLAAIGAVFYFGGMINVAG